MKLTNDPNPIGKYMVYNPNKEKPICTHETKRQAIDEALRLIQISPSEKYFIIQVIEGYTGQVLSKEIRNESA